MFKPLEMYVKLKKIVLRTVYMSLIAILLYILFASGTLYLKYENMSVTLGVNLGVKNTHHIETISETLEKNRISLKDADEIIEDARRRGILE